MAEGTEAGFSLELRSELSEVERLRERFEAFAEDLEFPPRTVFEVTLVLEEMLTNVIIHGLAGAPGHLVIVSAHLSGGVLRLRIEDDGVAFDPLSVPPPDLEATEEDRPIGGLGVHLARRILDSMRYERDGDRNILVMEKTVRAA